MMAEDRPRTEIDALPLAAEPGSSWLAPLRHLALFALLFALALTIMHLAPPPTARTYPNPLWLPVLVVSLHLGLGAGIAAAIVATGIFLWMGLPPQTWTEDLYQYLARVSAEPIGWTCMALLIGYLRGHQIRERSEMKAELAERDALCRNIATRYDALRQRADMLERHIAANGAAAHVLTVEARRAPERDPLLQSDVLDRNETF